MDMEELKQNPLLWVVGILLLVMVVGFFSINVVVDKATDAVIEKLQKEYSPGPYAPGFDPDKVNPNFWRNQPQPPTPGWTPPPQQTSIEDDDWRQKWEEMRK